MKVLPFQEYVMESQTTSPYELLVLLLTVQVVMQLLVLTVLVVFRTVQLTPSLYI